MSDWITDRLPTAEDADLYGNVWVTCSNGRVDYRRYATIEIGQPWQPIRKPAPYVKPKRWTVTRNFDQWCLVDGKAPDNTHYLPTFGQDLKAVCRICDIYNEVMP